MAKKKKQQTLGEMAAQVETIMASMEHEKERMAGVIAAALLDDFDAAVKLGRYSDKDLKAIVRKLAGHIDECVAELEAEKQSKKVPE